MLKSVLYVSRISEAFLDTQRWIDAMVVRAEARNRATGISGGLVSTNFYFAQILEGEAEPLERLIFRIAADVRHEDMRVLEYTSIERRTFLNWRLSHHGPSTYIGRMVELTLINHPDASTLDVRNVRDLVRGLAGDHP